MDPHKPGVAAAPADPADPFAAPFAASDAPSPAVVAPAVAAIAVVFGKETRIKEEVKSGEEDLSNLDWDCVDTDDTGKAVGVLAKPFEEYRSKQLRVICSRLKIRGVKNVKKEFMIQMIRETYRNRRGTPMLVSAEERGPAPKKESQCGFRLLNILFSNEFSDDFGKLGSVAGRSDVVDPEKAAIAALHEESFWTRVQAAFVDPSKALDYGCLQFTNDEAFGDLEHVDCTKIVNHDWKKLKAMWKRFNGEYKFALTRYTQQAGTHDEEEDEDDNFFRFVNGKLEVYYLRKLLELRPNLQGVVEAAALPDGCFISPDTTDLGEDDERKQPGGQRGNESDHTFSHTLGSAAKKRKAHGLTESLLTETDLGEECDDERKKQCGPRRNDSDFTSPDSVCASTMRKRPGNTPPAEALRAAADAVVTRKELAKQKLFFMQQQNTRAAAEHEWTAKEYEWKQNQMKFNQWEKIQCNLRSLRAELRETEPNTATAIDLQDDIDGLVKRKNELALELGMK